MRVNDDYKEWNVERKFNDEQSVYAFYKRALIVRKQYEVLVCQVISWERILTPFGQIYGDFEDISVGDEKIFAFVRRLGSAKALVVLNFSDAEVEFHPGEWSEGGYQIVLSNYHDDETAVRMRRFEGRVYVAI